jgi:rhodanese-related sulfurtransferase
MFPKSEAWRFLILLASSAGLGLGVNALSPDGVPVFRGPDKNGGPPRAFRMTAAAFESALRSGRSLALIDVRSDEAFGTGHPPAAFHAQASHFMDQYSRLSLGSVLKAAEGVVVLCDSDRCSSGDQVAEMLDALGHRPVYVLEGGWEKYRTSGLQIVRP